VTKAHLADVGAGLVLGLPARRRAPWGA